MSHRRREVDIRASFDTAESLRRARRLIAMYEAAGVDRSRVLVKVLFLCVWSSRERWRVSGKDLAS